MSHELIKAIDSVDMRIRHHRADIDRMMADGITNSMGEGMMAHKNRMILMEQKELSTLMNLLRERKKGHQQIPHLNPVSASLVSQHDEYQAREHIHTNDEQGLKEAIEEQLHQNDNEKIAKDDKRLNSANVQVIRGGKFYGAHKRLPKMNLSKVKGR